MPRGLPTDRELLEAIFARSIADFAAYDRDAPSRATKIWMPIDLEGLATRFRTDPDIIFGRLYYHLNNKHGHSDGEGDRVEFFHPRLGRDRHVVNFPLLAAVLADLREERHRFWLATGIAALSLVVSLGSIFIALTLAP